MLLDEKEIQIDEKLGNCTIIENPRVENKNIRVYFPNIEKSSIQLHSISGQEISLQSIQNQGEYLDIKPVSALPSGVYILRMKNTFQNECIRKVIIY